MNNQIIQLIQGFTHAQLDQLIQYQSIKLEYNCHNTVCHSSARCISLVQFSNLVSNTEFCQCNYAITGLYGDGCFQIINRGEAANLLKILAGVILLLVVFVAGYFIGRRTRTENRDVESERVPKIEPAAESMLPS